MKDTKSFLLVFLSLGLVGTWVYHLYDKVNYSKRRTEVYIKDSSAIAQAVQDSLQKMYSHTIINLDARLDSTQNTTGILRKELQAKLDEIRKLRSEINAIMRKNNLKKEDIDLVREKTVKMQRLIAELQNKNNTIEEEKKQITAVLDKVNIQVKNLEDNIQKLGEENKTLAEKVTLASAFIASEIKISPVTIRKNKELETDLAKKAGKLVISFALQNNVTDYENTEVFVIITLPSGKVLKNEDTWETSTFKIENGNLISYTRKVGFEYQKGESNRLIFSLTPEEYEKGSYTLQLYHNGYMIGQTTKTLK